MTKTLLVLAVAMAGSSTASAQSLPRYDPAASCEEVAATADGSRVIYNGCMQMEQEAYNDLKSEWSGLPSSTRDSCDEVARSGGHGTYAILQGCVDMETEAAGSVPEFEF